MPVLRCACPSLSGVGEHALERIHQAKFHAQTAVEASMQLLLKVIDRFDAIEGITSEESAVRHFDKKGPLPIPGERDHRIHSIVAAAILHFALNAEYYEESAAAMLHFALNAEHYEESAASDLRIDLLHDKMLVVEEIHATLVAIWIQIYDRSPIGFTYVFSMERRPMQSKRSSRWGIAEVEQESIGRL